jgi:hypothetical protein
MQYLQGNNARYQSKYHKLDKHTEEQLTRSSFAQTRSVLSVASLIHSNSACYIKEERSNTI